MRGELFGVGRTWIAVLALVVLGTVMLFFDKINADMWMNIIMFVFGGGAAKSLIVGTANALGTKKRDE